MGIHGFWRVAGHRKKIIWAFRSAGNWRAHFEGEQGAFLETKESKDKQKTTTTVLCPPPGLCLGLPRWAGSRKVKSIWIYWRKRQWVAVASAEHMQICISPQTDNHTSIPPLSFFTGRMPFLPPTNSIKALKADKQKIEGQIPEE